jgi:ketosteroid isomerase-like protein
MAAEDLAVANAFLETLAVAATSGEPEDVYPLLAPDVHWMTPQRDLRGVDELANVFSWFLREERDQVDFEIREQTDLGGGKIVTDFQEIHRVRETGELAYARDRRIVLTIRDGKIATYEMRFAG